MPCYDEDFEATLQSLGENQQAAGVEVVLVLNHSERASGEIKRKHEQQAAEWEGRQLENGIPVRIIRAFDLPAKQAGVGLARKIGMDEAWYRFAAVGHDGLILCLDGDCTVSANYLTEILKAEKANVNGLSIAFEHPMQGSEVEKQYMVDYETWLRYYVHALRYCGYPNAFHTIGSSMAVRASAYAKIGGMNRRKAGEDFYFLHKLIPQGQFYDLTSCTVFPSARHSERVPFGTGRAMLEMASGDKDFSEVYHPQIFIELRQWLGLAEAIFDFETTAWPTFVLEVFTQSDWLKELEALKKRSSSTQALRKNFRFWFDGFKMLKTVHHARDHHYPNVPARQAVGELFGWPKDSSIDTLQKLRDCDSNSAFAIFKP